MLGENAVIPPLLEELQRCQNVRDEWILGINFTNQLYPQMRVKKVDKWYRIVRYSVFIGALSGYTMCVCELVQN